MVPQLKAASDSSIDLGLGTSSFANGRPVNSLALGVDLNSWGIDFRSEGVQTTVYAQNAWTMAAYSRVYKEAVGRSFGDLSLLVGFGGSIIHRGYRTSISESTNTVKEYLVGPYLALKYQVSFFYIGADTVMGIGDLTQTLFLNYRDMSHFTIGLSL